MGYKLAGYDVLGGVEIDPKMMGLYRENHKPKYSYLMGVQQFNKLDRSSLPKELLSLDILDGSPPCSSFSMAGSREKAWGVKKKFREGQSEQVLDDLFFHFLETARILQPKIIVAENVKGLVMGKAKGYVKQIAGLFNQIGYDLQLFLLNASFMGVPQKRERTFFVGRKKNLNFKNLVLCFDNKQSIVNSVISDIQTVGKRLNTQKQTEFWQKTKPGSGLGDAGGFNSQKKINPNEAAFTQTSSCRHWHWSIPAEISRELLIRIQSFPDDYNFLDQDPGYVCGMSVPPFMMQRVATEIYRQLLSAQID